MDGTGSYSKSVLSSETDALITRIIGCAIRVHSELGPGFLETIYASVLEVEFAHEGLPSSARSRLSFGIETR